jgi:peptidoglycan/LPS O-acetylase OafA/YrhL
MRNSPNTIPYLDGWRGLAIVLVLQSHFGLGGGGRLGVALFFALSGYLMGELLFVKNVPLGRFFKRRFSRIVPTYWLYVAVAFALAGAAWYQAPYRVPADELVSTLLFARTYYPADASIWAGTWQIGHFWSLNVEEHSYIYLALLALVAGVAGVRRTWLLALSTLACLGLNLYYTLHPPGGASPWFARSECAALGLIASATLRAFRHEVPALRTGAAWIAPATLAVGAVCFSWTDVPILAITLGPLLLAVSINYVGNAPALLRDALSVGVLRWFGICSFSLYVWQQLAYVAYQHHLLQRQLAGAVGIGIGVVAFYLYEDPVRRWLNGERRTKPVAAVSVEPAAPVQAESQV